MQNPQALVIFSGGQDSTTCLIQAIQTYGRENVQAITFQYGQRHAVELERARLESRRIWASNKPYST